MSKDEVKNVGEYQYYKQQLKHQNQIASYYQMTNQRYLMLKTKNGNSCNKEYMGYLFQTKTEKDKNQNLNLLYIEKFFQANIFTYVIVGNYECNLLEALIDRRFQDLDRIIQLLLKVVEAYLSTFNQNSIYQQHNCLNYENILLLSSIDDQNIRVAFKDAWQTPKLINYYLEIANQHNQQILQQQQGQQIKLSFDIAPDFNKTNGTGSQLTDIFSLGSFLLKVSFYNPAFRQDDYFIKLINYMCNQSPEGRINWEQLYQELQKVQTRIRQQKYPNPNLQSQTQFSFQQPPNDNPFNISQQKTGSNQTNTDYPYINFDPNRQTTQMGNQFVQNQMQQQNQTLNSQQLFQFYQNQQNLYNAQTQSYPQQKIMDQTQMIKDNMLNQAQNDNTQQYPLVEQYPQNQFVPYQQSTQQINFQNQFQQGQQQYQNFISQQNQFIAPPSGFFNPNMQMINTIGTQPQQFQQTYIFQGQQINTQLNPGQQYQLPNQFQQNQRGDNQGNNQNLNQKMQKQTEYIHNSVEKISSLINQQINQNEYIKLSVRKQQIKDALENVKHLSKAMIKAEKATQFRNLGMAFKELFFEFTKEKLFISYDLDSLKQIEFLIIILQYAFNKIQKSVQLADKYQDQLTTFKIIENLKKDQEEIEQAKKNYIPFLKEDYPQKLLKDDFILDNLFGSKPAQLQLEDKTKELIKYMKEELQSLLIKKKYRNNPHIRGLCFRLEELKDLDAKIWNKNTDSTYNFNYYYEQLNLFNQNQN